jgi:hypothetical protein
LGCLELLYEVFLVDEILGSPITTAADELLFFLLLFSYWKFYHDIEPLLYQYSKLVGKREKS